MSLFWSSLVMHLNWNESWIKRRKKKDRCVTMIVASEMYFEGFCMFQNSKKSFFLFNSISFLWKLFLTKWVTSQRMIQKKEKMLLWYFAILLRYSSWEQVLDVFWRFFRTFWMSNRRPNKLNSTTLNEIRVIYKGQSGMLEPTLDIAEMHSFCRCQIS